MVGRKLQFYKENRPKATTSGDIVLSVDHPHLLFDVPLRATLREFLDILDEYYRPEIIFEKFDGQEDNPEQPPLFAFEQAINEVLDLPDTYHKKCTDLATDNTRGPPAEVTSWEELAAFWLWQYLSEYNRQLYDCCPDPLSELESSVTALQQDPMLTDDDIRALVGFYLSNSGKPSR